MSLTLQLPLTIEQQLRENATRQGVSLENYAMQILALNSRKKETKKKKDYTERELLVLAQLNVLPADLEEFYRLGAVFKSGKITDDEYEKLLQLNDLIEIAHAERMKYLFALAKLRNVSIETVMQDLGIKQHLA